MSADYKLKSQLNLEYADDTHFMENFLAQYPATISTIAAAATVAAVITALYIAWRGSRPCLEVVADIRRYISSEAQSESGIIDLNDAPRKIVVTIQNIGPATVSISYWSSFEWSVLGGKQVTAQNPAEPDFRHQPIELAPGKAASIVLSDDLAEHKAMVGDLAAMSSLGNFSRRFLRLTVITEVGDRFRAKLGKTLRQFSSEP